MSVNFLNRFTAKNKKDGAAPVQKKHMRWRAAIGLIIWMLLGYGIAQVLVLSLAYALRFLGVPLQANQTLLVSIGSLLVYSLTLLVVIGLPWWMKKYRTSKEDVGLTRPMSWTDIGLAPVGGVIYFLFAAILAYVFTQLVPGIDLTQMQETGFVDVTKYYQYLLVFIALVVVAPIAEETIFRGYLYGKLRQVMPIWVAMLLTSAVFGLVHGQWNVAIDVFGLSMVLCGLREITGSIWSGILLHMIKNGIAFYFLFIIPLISHTIGG